LSSVSYLRPTSKPAAIANQLCRKIYSLIPEQKIRLLTRWKALFRKFRSVRFRPLIGMSFALLACQACSEGREVSEMAENNFIITTDDTSADTSTVQQYFDMFRRGEHLEPEKSLLAAILEDAVQEYRKYSRAHDANGKKRFREVEEWIMRGGNDWIFSFDNVCDLLGLDPEYVRRGLRETLATPAEEKSMHRDRMRKRAA
jgi:hypothetical protein